MATAWFLMLAAVVTEQSVGPVSGGQGERHAWWRIDTGPVVASKWYRLMASPGAAVWINGGRLNAGEPGVFDVSGLRRRNVVVVIPPQPVRVSITPRVFVAGVHGERVGGEMVFRITVRNTLENTVNAGISLRTDGVLGDAPATVPPGVMQDVTIRFAGAKKGNEVNATVVLEKEEEAMEGGYRYEAFVRLPE